MNVVQEIRRINESEQRQGLGASASWHDDYKDSAYIYIGGLSYDLTEGDVICIFSQYGEIYNINLVRDKDTHKSKGYAFVQYEDQRSTVLAVDNLNGARVLGRTLRVDHVKAYRQPKQGDDELPTERVMNAAPEVVEVRSERSDDEEVMREAGIDPDDPMAAYYLKKYKRRMKKERSDRRSKRRSPSKESQVSKEPKASRRRRSRSPRA
ncbi:RNA-binding protein Cwf29 [Coemansia sp. RSA 1935]|nr:RNA-binding protein Cwf29 [Coemansia sp. RSA 1935]